MMPGGQMQTLDGRRPKDRRIVPAGRAEADPSLDHGQFFDGWQGAPGGIQQGEQATGGDMLVKALFHARD